MEGNVVFSKEGVKLLSEVETLSGRKTHEEFYQWDEFSWDIIKGYQNINGSYTKNEKGELHSIELQIRSCAETSTSTIKNEPRDGGAEYICQKVGVC